MVLGILQVQIELPGISSLKYKRSLLKRICNTVKKQYNVSVSEIGQQDQWDRSLLGFALLGTHRDTVEATLARLVQELEGGRGAGEVAVIDHQVEIL